MKYEPKGGWNILEQARKAKASFDERPAWLKRISYFAGTNNVPPTRNSSSSSQQEK